MSSAFLDRALAEEKLAELSCDVLPEPVPAHARVARLTLAARRVASDSPRDERPAKRARIDVRDAAPSGRDIRVANGGIGAMSYGDGVERRAAAAVALHRDSRARRDAAAALSDTSEEDDGDEEDEERRARPRVRVPVAPPAAPPGAARSSVVAPAAPPVAAVAAVPQVVASALLQPDHAHGPPECVMWTTAELPAEISELPLCRNVCAARTASTKVNTGADGMCYLCDATLSEEDDIRNLVAQVDAIYDAYLMRIDLHAACGAIAKVVHVLSRAQTTVHPRDIFAHYYMHRNHHATLLRYQMQVTAYMGQSIGQQLVLYDKRGRAVSIDPSALPHWRTFSRNIEALFTSLRIMTADRV